MSCDNHCPPYRHKFKGIENFLRRVAFNLGNTPSQTEVKIISCIPIDVTDLQQKINTLERELNEVRTGTNYSDNIKANVKNTPNPTRQATPIVQTALGKPIPMFCKSKSKTQCKYSQAKTSVTSQGCNTKLNKPRKCRFKRKGSSVCNVSSFSSQDKSDGEYNMAYKVDPNFSRTKVPVAKGCYKVLGTRIRKALRRNPGKRTHLVYFAQASKTPFNNYHKTSLSADKRAPNKNTISRAYINSMIRKQYESELIVDELTDISQYSSPACRDNSNNGIYGTDLSHSYENFRNLDKINPSRNQNIAVNNGLAIDQGPVTKHYHKNNRINYSGYYDSDNYDIYPVKEKSTKHNNEEPPQKQIRRSDSDGLPENFRTKNKLRPLLFDTYGTLDKRYDCKYQGYKIYDGNGNEYALTNVTKKKTRNSERLRGNSDESKLCSIDYGDVYVKRNHVIECMEKSKRITPSFKNAECLTVNTNHIECQTVESKGVQLSISDDNKAEVVLNQIKTILQSVLTEVKTNIKSSNAVNKSKKDVPIQKDISYNNMTGGSTLLNSFTYNPSYSVNPCLPTYSRHIPNFCYANFSALPIKYFQNHPLCVPPIKPDCECNHKKMVREEKSLIDTKPATTAATNTDTEPRMTRKSETVNLIKEIYKSIALNVNYSNKNTSRISFGYQKNHGQTEVKSINSKEITVTQQAVVGNNNTFDVLRATLTSNTTNEITHDVTDTGPESVQSDIRSESVNHDYTKESQSTTNYESVRSSNKKTSQATTNCAEEKTENASGHVKNETAEQNGSKDGDVQPNVVTNESDSDDTLVADESTQRKQKPGLLQKVLRSVKKFKIYKPKGQKRSAKGDIDSEESGTESQTVYSYKTYKDLNPAPKNNTSKPKLTVQADTQVDKSFQENVRRLSPYMEQEYRRYWEEKLMFHEGKSPLHSSEKSHAWTRSPQSPMYWRGYEARSAILKDGQLKLPRGYRRGDENTQERTGLKLEWMKKQKFKSIKEHQ